MAGHPQEIIRKRKYLFTVSHMRARTTLLSHIFGSNTEICGHNELHISYRTTFDIYRLKANLLKEHNYTSATYLHDKILHNKLEIDPGLFGDQLKVVLVVREPVATLNSMAEMHRKVWGNDNYTHLEDYYCKRLAWLSENFGAIKDRVLFIDSDMMVKEPDNVLNELSKYLNLKVPLVKEYQVFGDTGQAGKGDPGDNIKSGQIVNTGRSADKKYNFGYSKAIQSHKMCSSLFQS